MKKNSKNNLRDKLKKSLPEVLSLITSVHFTKEDKFISVHCNKLRDNYIELVILVDHLAEIRSMLEGNDAHNVRFLVSYSVMFEGEFTMDVVGYIPFLYSVRVRFYKIKEEML